MIVLDENLIASQCEELRRHGIRFRRIGEGVGHRGMDDVNDVIPALHRLRATFFSADRGFYYRSKCHPAYCLVFLEVDPLEQAAYARRFLRHPEFRTAAQRMGAVVRVSPSGITCWRRGGAEEERVAWGSP